MLCILSGSGIVQNAYYPLRSCWYTTRYCTFSAFIYLHRKCTDAFHWHIKLHFNKLRNDEESIGFLKWLSAYLHYLIEKIERQILLVFFFRWRMENINTIKMQLRHHRFYCNRNFLFYLWSGHICRVNILGTAINLWVWIVNCFNPEASRRQAELWMGSDILLELFLTGMLLTSMQKLREKSDFAAAFDFGRRNNYSRCWYT